MSVVVTNLRKNNNKNTHLTAICFGVEFGAYLDTKSLTRWTLWQTNQLASVSTNIDANN